MNRPEAVRVSTYRLAFTIGLITVMLMSGCSSSDDDAQGTNAMDTSPLMGPVWIWDGYQVAEEAVVPLSLQPKYSLEFVEDSRYGGYENCNAYSGTWVGSNNALQIVDFSADGAVCDVRLPENTPIFNTTLRMSSTFSVAGDRLTITAADGTRLLFGSGEDVRLNP